MSFRSGVWMLLACLSLSGPAWADKWLATPGNGGNNANPGTQAQPWATLSFAVPTMAAGETLWIGSGTYAGFFLNGSGGGATNQYKTLRPMPGATAILDAALTTHGGQGVVSMWGDTVGWVHLDGTGGVLRITDSATGPADHQNLQPGWWPCQNMWQDVGQNCGGSTGACNGCLVGTDPGANVSCVSQTYSFVFSRRQGINLDWLGTSTQKPHHIKLTAVEFTRLGNIAIWGLADDVEVINSHIHNNDLYGSYIYGARHVWRGNHVHHNRSVGLRFGHDGDPGHAIIGKLFDSIIENNIIHHNFGRVLHTALNVNEADLDTGGYGIIAYGAYRNLFRNNLIYDNAWNDRWGNRCDIWGLMVMDRLEGNNQVYNNTVTGHNPTSATPAPGFLNYPFGPQNTVARNNIFWNNKDDVLPGTNTVFSNNLCTTAQTGCQFTTSNPQFAGAGAGDYHLLQGSPAIDQGFNLAGLVPLDLEGVARPVNSFWDIGAYEFTVATPPQPDPVTELARWEMEHSSGTTATDATGNGHTGTLDSAAWATGIIGSNSFAPTGTQEISVSNTTGFDTPNSCSLTAWINMTSTGTSGCAVVSDREGCALYITTAGMPQFWITTTGGTQLVVEGQESVLTGTNRFLAGTYDAGVSGAGLRLSVDASQVPAFTPTSAALSYTAVASPAFRIGREGATYAGFSFQCIGRIDQVRRYSGQLSSVAIQNLFNELSAQPGLSVTHQAYYAADATQGQQLGTTDADYAVVLGTPIGMRWAIHKADAGSLTEYFRPHCRTDTGAGYGTWTEVTNSLDSLGVRFHADSVLSTGSATSILLPTDGFTGIPGKVIESPADLTSPYDAAQRMTLSQGEHAEMQVQLAFGAPLSAGDTVQCRPTREDGTEFCATCYSNITTLALQSVAPPSAVRLGATIQGGTFQ